MTIKPVVGLAFLTDAEMAKLWQAIGLAYKMGVLTDGTCNIVRIAILTGQRHNECAGLEVGPETVSQGMARIAKSQFTSY